MWEISWTKIMKKNVFKKFADGMKLEREHSIKNGNKIYSKFKNHRKSEYIFRIVNSF